MQSFDLSSQIDVAQLRAQLPFDLAPVDAFSSILTDVSAQQPHFDKRVDDSSEVYTKSEQPPKDAASDVHQNLAKLEAKMVDVSPLHVDQNGLDELLGAFQGVQAVQQHQGLDHLLAIVERIVVDYNRVMASQRGAVQHYYQLSDRLNVPLDISFRRVGQSLEVVLYSDGQLKTALAASVDELTKRLRKQLSESDVSVSVKSIKTAPVNVQRPPL